MKKAQYDDEQSLAIQLSPLLTDLSRARRAAQVRLVQEHTNLTVNDGNHWDTQIRRFRQARDSIELLGGSVAEYITITSVGMTNANVTIAQGALDELTESAFLSELAFAYSDLWTDWCEALRDLKNKHNPPLM